MRNKKFYIIFSVVGAVLVLWQLLSSGYVLTLDMVFGPHVNLIANEGDFLNTLPLKYILYFLTFIFNGWEAQKFLLIFIGFLLFYLPLHFFRRIFNLKDTHRAEYVASLFFAINPFVYERFLAGQWAVIFGYAMLVPVFAYLSEFYRDWNIKNTLKLLASIIILGVISTHVLMMVLIIIPVALICNLIPSLRATRQAFLDSRLHGNDRKNGLLSSKGGQASQTPRKDRTLILDFIKKCLILGLGFIMLSSYWLIPVFLSKTTPLSIMGAEHWEVFKTAGNGYFGALGNVLSLHGFWGEHEKWVQRFVLPKEGGWVFISAIILFFTLFDTGIYSAIKNIETRRRAIFAVAVMVIVVIFSCGIGEGIFRNFNMWIFEHISFWKGFRDTEKWSAILAFGYAVFAGLGARQIFLWTNKTKYKRIVFCALMAIPVFYTPMMLFGFAGRLQTSQYPDSWAKVNEVLKQYKNCKAIFLPWHQYYSLKFNNNILTGNVANSYFDCNIVSGKNMELGSITSQGGNGDEYSEIEKAVIDNNANPDATIDFFKQKGIKYIIFTNDLIYEDVYGYPFIGSSEIQKVVNEDDIHLYSIK